MKKSFRQIISVFGDNWSSVVVLNGVFFPFVLPLAVWMIICQCYSSVLIKFDSPLNSWYIVTFAGLLPTLIIAFLGLSGYFEANRAIFYEQDGNVVQAFIKGFKQNWARFLLYGVICWASLTVAVTSSAFYLTLNMNPLLCGVCMVLSIMQAFIIIPATFICMVQGVFFEDEMKNVMGNAFRVLFIKPVIFLYSIVAVVPFAVTIILPLIWQISAWILVALVFSTVSVTFLTVNLGNVFFSIINRDTKIKSESV